MSVQAMQWAFNADVPSVGAKATLVALANFADEEGTCFPGRDRLADMTSQSPRTVSRHLQTLHELGLVEHERRHRDDGTRTTNRYRLALGDNVTHGPSDNGDRLGANLSRHEPSLEPNPPQNATRSTPPRRKAVPLPASWQPNDTHRELAKREGVNCGREAAKFREHALSKGRTLKDWDAGFRQWLLHAAEFGRRPADPAPQTPSDPVQAARSLGQRLADAGSDREEVVEIACKDPPYGYAGNTKAQEALVTAYDEAVTA